MESVFSTLVSPNSSSARDVLAFVLCPASVLVGAGNEDETFAAAQILAPAKEAAAKRFLERSRHKLRN